MKGTTEDFIEKSKYIFGNNEFDYSKVNYIDSYTNVLLKHNKCGNWFKIIPNNHTSIANRNSCPFCKTGYLIINEIIEWLNTLKIDYIINDRIQLNGKEIDFYFPSIKFGMEFQGD